MTKEGIVGIINDGVSAGTLTIEDVLICVNKILEENVKTLLKKSSNKMSFNEERPHLVSCCFSQVQELDIKEIRLENELVFSCEDPETHDIYELNTDDFLVGELRHVLDKI